MNLTGERAVFVGGSSDLAGALGCALAGAGLKGAVLLGRDSARLQANAAKLRAAGLAVEWKGGLEALAPEGQRPLLAEAFALAERPSLVVVTVGLLGPRSRWVNDPQERRQVLYLNGVGAASLLLDAVDLLRAQGGGVAVVFSSLAALVPRPTNYLYGAGKAALDHLARGLDLALWEEGVRVVTVRPGFVRTRMTAGLPKPPFAAAPEAVAAAVVAGLRKDAAVIYAPPAVRGLALALALLPRPLRRKLEL